MDTSKASQSRRTSKTLPATLYCYVEKSNAVHARTHGKKLFGSFSAYVNALIAKDRGVKPVLGFWKAKGEAKAKRLAAKAKKAEKINRKKKIAKEVA